MQEAVWKEEFTQRTPSFR